MPVNGNSATHIITVDATSISRTASGTFNYSDEYGRTASSLSVKTGQSVAWLLRDGNVADPSKVHLFIFFASENNPFDGDGVFHTTGAKAGEIQPTTSAGVVRDAKDPIDFNYHVAVIDETDSTRPVAFIDDPVIHHSGSGGG